MKCILAIVLAGVILILGAFLFVWSGFYNIAATRPHYALTFSMIGMLRERSIEVHSDEIKVPDLKNAALKEKAVIHYHEMCRLCHGAPGYPPEEFSEGLYPSPPVMASGKIQSELSDSEIFWVLKNGLKMTGMPAFGPTHNDEILWGLVALSRDIPGITPSQYNHMVENAEMKGEGDEHHMHMHEGQEDDQHNSNDMPGGSGTPVDEDAEP